MRHVEFDPQRDLSGEALEEWNAAVARADTEVDVAIAANEGGDEYDWSRGSPIWTTFKNVLLSVAFAGKCAYCESKIAATSWGDADHWRPKGAVTVPGKDDDGVAARVAHPGYYWLAYSWRNLLPACQRCNTQGKGTLFPVAAMHVATRTDGPTPDVLDDLEHPLLLHAIFGERPEHHIRFDTFGEAVPVRGSELGKLSIKVFGLNRGSLAADRRMEQDKARDAIKSAIKKMCETGESFDETLPEWVGPTAEYSRAVIADAQRRLRQAIAKDEARLARMRAGLDADAGGDVDEATQA